MRILLTPSVACCSTFENQARISIPITSQVSKPSPAQLLHLRCGRFRVGTTGHTVKTPLISNIINQQNPHSTPIIRRRNRAKPFLSRSIPDLQFHSLAVELDGADFEVDAYGGDEGGGEGVFAEAEEAAGFAYAGVAYEEEFDL